MNTTLLISRLSYRQSSTAINIDDKRKDSTDQTRMTLNETYWQLLEDKVVCTLQLQAVLKLQ